MKQWRPHRFVPLSELMDSSAWRSGVPLHMSPRLEASVNEGFQQGMDRGYTVGHEQGVREGREIGLAQGQDDGRRLGVELGKREMRAQFDLLAAPVDAMLEGVKGLQADFQNALRKEVVDLVAKVARQVIRCELALQPTQLLSLVDATLAAMPPAPDGVIEVYLNEGDLQRIREVDHSRAARWNLIADSRLESGECRVKSGSHEVDAGCKQRLAACMEQVSAQLLPHDETMEVAA